MFPKKQPLEIGKIADNADQAEFANEYSNF